MYDTISSFDTKMLFNVIRDSWKQAEAAWNRIDTSSLDNKRIKNIVITGLGGSAIGGDLLNNFLRNELRLSLIINRTYNIPAFADENTLVIASSYSGNTEETLSAVQDALAKKCMVVALTTGGSLAELATDNNIMCVSLMEGFQPRYALYNSFFRLLRLFQDLGLVPPQDEIVTAITGNLMELGRLFSSENNRALTMAQKIHGSVPVIYSTAGLNDAVGRRFKGQLNENSKMHAWGAEYTEMNHNEIVGWETSNGSNSFYKVINIVDSEMNARVSRRIDTINSLINSQKIDILTIEGSGASFKERLIECVYICDWISYYLAILNQKDPGEIDFIHYLKKKMSEV